MSQDKYITTTEIAAYLHMSTKSVREYFIHGRRVQYLMVGNKFLVLRDSFLEWERLHLKTLVNRR